VPGFPPRWEVYTRGDEDDQRTLLDRMSDVLTREA
jgi:hypothetical protein